jgi:hypothetical protein
VRYALPRDGPDLVVSCFIHPRPVQPQPSLVVICSAFL